MQNGTEHTSTSTTSSSDDVPTTANTDTSSAEPRSSNNEDNNNISNNQSSNTITNNPEEYNDLNELVDDIKNSVVDTNEISLNAFKDSGAYQGADQNTKDCIDLAGKIGGNLIDYEIVRCSEDTNFFLDQIASSDDNNDNNNNNADDTGN
jgi:hypothetical protein